MTYHFTNKAEADFIAWTEAKQGNYVKQWREAKVWSVFVK